MISDKTAEKTTKPSTGLTSALSTPCTAYWPAPPHENTISTSTAPPMRKPYNTLTMVTIAGSAARTAWRSTTCRGKPHISAYWTNSDVSARLTIVCVIFRIGPALMMPSVRTGKIRCPNDEDSASKLPVRRLSTTRLPVIVFGGITDMSTRPSGAAIQPSCV